MHISFRGNYRRGAKEEAEFLLNAVKPYKVKLPLVLDLEMIDGDDRKK